MPGVCQSAGEHDWMSHLSADPLGPRPRGGIAALYHATRKRDDMRFNTYVCRPLAAVFVYALRESRVAPNQVTFFSLALSGVAVALLVFLPWPLGLWLGVAVYELSYVFDKVDGMLARSRGIQSATGHLLDFLMDEIKAFSILAAVATGAYLQTGRVELLFWGLVGVVCLASGIGMTTFQRRPEVLAASRARPAVGAAPPSEPDAASSGLPHEASTASAPAGALGLRTRLVRLAEGAGHFFIHYPSYIWLAAVLGDARIYLYPYVVVNVLYCGRTLLGLVVRYGAFEPRKAV
jgi:phosphatidylglycerophosphate synthase